MDDGGIESRTLNRFVFWDAFVDAMKNGWTAEFAARYNNGQDYYRARNTRPRTDCMIKGEKSLCRNVVEALRQSRHLPATGEISAERYIDLAYYSGNWWTGEKQPIMALEVENDWKELRGTLRDLFQFQAKLKIGVFYRPDPGRCKSELQRAIVDVSQLFVSQGFAESESAEYLIVVAPEECPPIDQPSESLAVAYEFRGISSADRGNWHEAAIWISAARNVSSLKRQMHD